MDKLIKYLKKIVVKIENGITQITCFPEKPVNIMAVTLLSSIFENTVACVYLLEKELYSSIPLILRSIVEAHIDLINLSKDENYLNYIEATFHKERKRLIKNIIARRASGFFKKAITIPDLDQKLLFHETTLAKLKSQGYHPLRIEDKFEKADKSELYVSVYYLLCHEFHNDTKSLEERHVDLKSRKITIFKERLKSEMQQYIDGLAGVLVVSFQSIFKILQLPEDGNIKDAIKLLDEMRKAT